MPNLSYTLDLTGNERANGSMYFTCEELPGFHFILAPEEDIDSTLIPALKEFMALHLTYKIRTTIPRLLRVERAPVKERPSPEPKIPAALARRRLVAEFEMA